ncbi:site-specific integrase [Hoeflea sp. WL0058]|uniref:Site-specific integrase n=1 Tax=Flavimaribacter sediminis TaxID=2865987 RepID=A0AAE2ZQP3_9HYPH|nr:site-specific integrase [Flavimaribacter sediminis]MBW8639166.1 site-specific integrase [Flavimaribacter sediminis]
MQYREMRETLSKHFSQLLEAQRNHIDATGPLSQLDRSVLQGSLRVAEGAVGGRNTLSLTDDDNLTLQAFVAEYELPVESGTPEFEMLRRELHKAYRAYCRSVLQYDDEQRDYDFGARISGHQAGTFSDIDTEYFTLNAVVRDYIAENDQAKSWAPRSRDQKISQLSLLEEVLGSNTDIAKVTIKEAQHVKRVIMSYPKNKNKLPHTKHLSIDDILQRTGLERLSTQSMNGYIQTYGGLFEWARRQGYVKENVFSGLSIRKAKNSKPVRTGFTKEQVENMIDELVTNSHDLLTRDYQLWVTLIAVYTGARLNEICQLQTVDVKQENGVWCLSFNDEGEQKRLKTQASRRIVPIHSQLNELGFLTYCTEQQQSSNTRLFPELSYSPKHGYARMPSRWFNEQFLPRLGLKSRLLVFHSFRETMATALFHAGIEQPLVQSIVGHQREGVTQQHYFKDDYTIQQRRDALEKVSYSLPGQYR